jgi:voltage-gated potassium channel Kch
MEQAIYWSVVTTTTIGYGDLSPSITASQMTLLAMLLIAFTLLPYQVCGGQTAVLRA